MLPLISSNKTHDFYHYQNDKIDLFNIVLRDSLSPMAGYTSAAGILHKTGYLPSYHWPEELARERFFELANKEKKLIDKMVEIV
ncbi:MAG: hypothetical protein RQ856_06405 [Candidatus Izemoplasmatales bacterium]|nr:hypothetical protein [Candidatus Izemoplasmatales bacterium]